MSAKANPTKIGAFVVGSIVLLLVCLAVFGGGKFFEDKFKYVAFFEGSVAGLAIGAPVTWQGVPIGSVTSIRLQINPSELKARIPVYFDVIPTQFDLVGDVSGTMEERVKKLIDAGLRAQLTSVSLVTGQLAIEVSFEPGTPVNMVAGDFDAIQVPTIPSTVQKLMGELQKLRLDQLVENANKLIIDVDALITTPDAKKAIPDLRALIDDAKKLVNDLDAEIKPTVASFKQAADSATGAFDEGKTAIAHLDTELKPAVADVRKLVRDFNQSLPGMVKRLDAALASAQSAMDAVDRVVQPDSATMKDLRRTLTEFSAAAYSVRALADELERNPSVLIRGK